MGRRGEWGGEVFMVVEKGREARLCAPSLIKRPLYPRGSGGANRTTKITG